MHAIKSDGLSTYFDMSHVAPKDALAQKHHVSYDAPFRMSRLGILGTRSAFITIWAVVIGPHPPLSVGRAETSLGTWQRYSWQRIRVAC